MHSTVQFTINSDKKQNDKGLDVNFNSDGDIIDALSGKILKDTPEERVRQRFINILQYDF